MISSMVVLNVVTELVSESVILNAPQ
jgi:hypothetical protein